MRRRFLLGAAVAALPLFAHADTPPVDAKALGPPDRVLFWTPAQQRSS
jgi:hypothetical protein